MKELVKKIGWFSILIAVVGCVLFINCNSDLKKVSADVSSASSAENSYYDGEEYYDVQYTYNTSDSDDFGFFGALFIEAFVTIHMSVFVLSPISKIFGKDKHKLLFKILFIIRIIILIIGDLISPGGMMMIDFFSVFIGAFLVVPLCAVIKGVELNHRSNQPLISLDDKSIFNNKDVSDDVLAIIGFGDKEVVKKGLIQHYIDIINLYNKKDFHSLVKLCSPGVYTTYKNELELYDKVNETRMVSDVVCNNAFIVSASKHGQQIFIDLKVNYSCYEYVLDQYNNIIRGSNTKRKKYTKILSFSQKLTGTFITTCPNCNASINEDGVEYCSYCGTQLNFNIGDWILKKEIILEEK